MLKGNRVWRKVKAQGVQPGDMVEFMQFWPEVSKVVKKQVAWKKHAVELWMLQGDGKIGAILTLDADQDVMIRRLLKYKKKERPNFAYKTKTH